MADEWIIGRHPVAEAIQSGREINKIWINKQSQGLSPALMEQLKERNITVQFVPRQKLDQLAGTERHQGIVASVAAHDYADIDDLFKKAEAQGEDPFFIMLDGLEDPHNLGSVLRTADAVGAHGVIIPKNRAVGLTSVVAKASTGAIEYIPVVRVTNLARTMKELKERGVWFIGTAADAPKDYKEIEGNLPLCLVIGNEGKGMSRLVRESCDFLIKIPMRGHVTSLNASVATGLLLYEILRVRESRGS